MKEFNYLKEKARMLKALGHTDKGHVYCNADCTKCPLSHWNNKGGGDCRSFEANYPDEATDAVRKWAEEHPARTRKDMLHEAFPKATIDGNCARKLGLCSEDDCRNIGGDCFKCWNTEVEE